MRLIVRLGGARWADDWTNPKGLSTLYWDAV